MSVMVVKVLLVARSPDKGPKETLLFILTEPAKNV